MSGAPRDALGARMKEDYEFRARPMLPRRTWMIIRADGRAFHSYTRDLERPFDSVFVADMAATAAVLAREVSGCRLAYVQSDEISLVCADFDTPTTQAWFGGNQQKIVSITASLATQVFNELRPGKRALFDSRAFVIPDPVEVENYLIWRQNDAVRNSIQMSGQAKLSHRDMHGLSTADVQEALWRDHGVNWNDYPVQFRRGTLVFPETVIEPVTYIDRRFDREITTPAVERRVWRVEPAFRFTADRARLAAILAAAMAPAVTT